jgi:signal transduction histidine kinase
METGYELRLHRFLIGYRFAAFWLAVILIQVVPGPEALGGQEYFILSLVGVYTLLKVLSPMRWRETGSETYILLAGDLALALLLILFTNGIDSGYLLYSLTPIITAAVLMSFRMALGVAIITAGAPLLAHLAISPFTDQYEWIMDGNRLPILLLYSALAFLMPVLASRTNLNIRRVIEMDAVLEERQRIRREVHDGVAQALNYLNMQAGSVTKALSSQEGRH